MSAIDRANYVHVSDFCFVCRVSAGSSPPPETWTNWAGSPRTYFLHSCPDCSEKLMSREGLPSIGEEPARCVCGVAIGPVDQFPLTFVDHVHGPVGQVLTRAVWDDLIPEWGEELSREIASARVPSSTVYMDGSHHPKPSEILKARRFLDDLGTALLAKFGEAPQTDFYCSDSSCQLSGDVNGVEHNHGAALEGTKE